MNNTNHDAIQWLEDSFQSGPSPFSKCPRQIIEIIDDDDAEYTGVMIMSHEDYNDHMRWWL
jgi:hypothetical protein